MRIKVVTANQFIFSEKITDRFIRHAIFWFVFILHIFIFRFYVLDIKYLSSAATYVVRLKDLLFFLPVSFFYAYFAIYFLLPRYILTGKYTLLFWVILLVSSLLVIISYSLSKYFDIRLAWDLPMQRANTVRQIDFTFTNGLVLPLTVSGFAIGIKMSKNFYLKQKQNERLTKQKIDAEVQLLKSQVHPRFLFHSLQSIYNDMLNGAQQAPGMLLKLSELLSYILYESNEIMLLEKELVLLKSYIDLEKAGWGENLVTEIDDETGAQPKLIEPLLLLPLAEYIFIHADKNKKQQMFLKLNMQIKQEIFYLVLEGRSEFVKNSFKENAQLLQVQKRLQAQYPNKHEFNVTGNKNGIIISLSLVLKNVLHDNYIKR